VNLFAGLLDGVGYFFQIDIAHDVEGVFRHISRAR
jgi:hypothetical protein